MFMRIILVTLFLSSLTLSAADLESHFDNLSDGQWLVWDVAIDPDSGWHCWGHRYNKPTSNTSRTLMLYLSQDDFNMATDNCDVELNDPIKRIANVSARESAQFIVKQLQQHPALADNDKLLHALALHRDPLAFSGLKAFFNDYASDKQQELINLFMTSYWERDGFNFVADQLTDGLSFSREKTLIFALSQSPVAEAQALVYQRARHGASREIRKEAIFWYSQFKSAGIADQLVELLATEKDQGLLEHIVFAIAQVKDGEGLDNLMRLIRTSKNDKVRQQALFWLAHSDEERAMPILEELLLGKGD